MKFYGISKTFSTVNEGQYKSIGEYWDFFSSAYGRKNIKGLGYNWRNGTSIEYVMGLVDRKPEFDLEFIQKKYPDCIYKEIELPDDGWERYVGRTEDIGAMYGKIYEDGPLTYEIESFDDEGNCTLDITRERLNS